MEKEIQLINDIIVNAIAHGADMGGSYEQNVKGLSNAMNRWIKEKGLQDSYHVIRTSRKIFESRGYWPTLEIAPMEKKDEFPIEDLFELQIAEVETSDGFRN